MSRPVLWQDDGERFSGGRMWCEYITSDLCGTEGRPSAPLMYLKGQNNHGTIGIIHSKVLEVPFFKSGWITMVTVITPFLVYCMFVVIISDWECRVCQTSSYEEKKSSL